MAERLKNSENYSSDAEKWQSLESVPFERNEVLTSFTDMIGAIAGTDVTVYERLNASNDKAVSPLNSIAYYTALYKAGIEKSSLHLFPTGGHAISLRAQRGSTVMWPELAEAWLIENGFLSPL